MSKGTSINITDLSKRYSRRGDDVLKGITLSIPPGKKFGILGPNGAGKTTLISILCGLIPPSTGDVNYVGELGNLNVQNMKLQLGLVPQEYALYEALSPLKNLAYFGAMYNMTPAQITKRSETLLSVLGLSGVGKKPVKTFSGGMKRRLNLAIGVMHEPAILFLDEPTVGVDVQSKNAIIKYLDTLNEQGTTIVYTSHHLNEAEEFCDEIALIDVGKIVVQGKTRDLLAEHDVTELTELFLKLTGEAYRDV